MKRYQVDKKPDTPKKTPNITKAIHANIVYEKALTAIAGDKATGLETELVKEVRAQRRALREKEKK